jgi:hypothetical protein
MYDVFLHPNVLLDDYFNLYLLSNYVKSFFDAGLPVRNNDRHASEIARFALKMLNTISDIKFCNNTKSISLRIGIHSGM